MACTNRGEDREEKGPGEGDLEGERMMEVSKLWPQGTLRTNPFTVQASQWFDSVKRAHEEEHVKLLKGSAPRAAGRFFPSLRRAREQ